MWSNKDFTKILEKNQHSTLYSANNTCYIPNRTQEKKICGSKEGKTMNINKFTQNSLQAVQNCEKIAADNGNQELA